MPVSMRFGSLINGKYSILDRLQYKYDSCGNITEIRENDILQARYEYDKLNRIVREDNKVFGKTWLYSYDYNGNILSKKEYAFTLKTDDELEELDSETVVYGYYGDRLMSFGEELCDYDVLGNPTTYRNNDLSWVRGRQLDKFGSLKFAYDGQGRRIKKGDVAFTYDSNGKLLKQSNGISFIYDNSGVVGLKYGDKTYFYRKDVQGNIIAILDSTGDVVVEYTYDAWGNHVVTPTEEAYTELSQLNPFRYRGYYYDTETNLYYLKTRYYDPEVGRFITIDDLSYLDPETINGLNLYAYCGNNPVMFTDPNGTTKWWEWLIGGIIVVGLIVGAVAATICTGGVFAAALTGAAIGASMSLGSQAISGNLNWGQFVLDIGVGALSGAIGASGISKIGATIAGTIIGGTSNVASQLIGGKSLSEINWLTVGISAIMGGVSGYIGGAGAKNKLAMDDFISHNGVVIKAQNSVAKVGDKMANGLYATARGAKSAYTQVMNKLSKAIFSAASSYSRKALILALSSYGVGTAIMSGLSFIPGLQ